MGMHNTLKAAAIACVTLSAVGCDGLPWVVAYKAHKGVAQLLFDPASAQYRNEGGGNRIKSYCGEVNAKNKIGDYAGFTPYVYLDGAALMSNKSPDFQEYFRDGRSQNDMRSNAAMAKIYTSCFVTTTISATCSELPRPASSVLSACYFLLKGGDDADANIKEALRRSSPPGPL
jgi:hypothetical protein